jgi:hypothetical protein
MSWVKPIYWGILNTLFVITFSVASGATDRTINSIYIEGINHKQIMVSSISLDFMTELYMEIKKEEGIPFKYPDDGCYARAHKMALLLDTLGVVSVKSFIIGDLRLTTKYSPSGYVDWWYHVAPSVHVKDIGELMVFDPTSSEQPITKTEWMDSLVSHRFGNIDEAFETVRFVYGPDDAYEKPELTEYKREDLVDMQEILDYFLDLLDQRFASNQVPMA